MLKEQIIEDNENFIVLNKPNDLSIHSESGSGLIEQLRLELDLPTLTPVHRLDKATSGVLLIAKNQSANRALSRLFQEKKIEKIYLGLLDKKPRKSQGKIEGDMLKSRNGSWRLGQSKNNPALTLFFSYAYAPRKRVAILRPLTGKTHQLRVAMKAMGSPIVGDTRYGGTASDALGLHAWQVKFSWEGKIYHYCAELMESDRIANTFLNQDLMKVLDTIGSPFDLAWPCKAR